MASGSGPSTSFLQLNAAPYAEVESVVDSQGKAFPLPAGSHMTPMRLEGVLEGSYTVTFKAADGSEQKQVCNQIGDQICLAPAPSPALSDDQINQILDGQK